MNIKLVITVEDGMIRDVFATPNAKIDLEIVDLDGIQHEDETANIADIVNEISDKLSKIY